MDPVCSVLVKTSNGTGVESCTRFRNNFEATTPCTTVETCGAPVGVIRFASSDSDPDADMTCEINRCK